MTRREMKCLAGFWWCRGAGMAVLALLFAVVAFRAAGDFLFWAALALFLSHLGLSSYRYLADHRRRSVATVTRVHDAPPYLPVCPKDCQDVPSVPFQQTKTAH